MSNPNRIPSRRRPHVLGVWASCFCPVRFPLLLHVARLSIDDAILLAKHRNVPLSDRDIDKARRREEYKL